MKNKKHYKRLKVMWFLVLIVSITDLMTTYIGLQKGLVESNPLGDYFIQMDLFFMLVIIKVIVILFCYYLTKYALPLKYRIITPLILFTAWGIATIVNTYLIIYISF